MDINRIKFSDKFRNTIYSTCPVVPRYHATFGEPIERQELSVEWESLKSIDAKKDEAKKLMGRVDEIIFHKQTDLYLVKDDFQKHIMYDCAFSDLKDLSSDITKIISYFIGKHEPMLNTDLKEVFPSLDRMTLIDDGLDCEV